MRKNLASNPSNQVATKQPDWATRRKKVLVLCNGLKIADEIRKYLNIPKYTMSKDCTWLLKQGYIEDLSKGTNKFKCFKQTKLGCEWLDQFEKDQKKFQDKLETPRHKFIIPISDLAKVELMIAKPEYRFQKSTWTNCDARYNGVIENFKVMILIYSKEIKVVITSPPIYEEDIVKLHHKFHQTAIEWCYNLFKKWSINYQNLQPLDNNQYTIKNQVIDDIDDVVLKGDQLKIQMDVNNPHDIIDINSSKGTETRLEAQRNRVMEYLQMPSLMQKLVDVVEKLETKQDVLINAVKDIADSNTKTANILASMMESGQLKERQPEKQPKKNNDVDRMFQ